MDCRQANEHIQAWLDGGLADDELAALQSHLEHCPRCREASREWAALQRALRELPAPEPPPDLTERLWAGQPRRRHYSWSVAAAAGLVLALVLTPFLVPDGREAPDGRQPVASLQVPADGNRTLQLSLSSPQDLEQVELTLVLPDNLALEGYPGQQVLRWKTDLLAGDNRLSLPLEARTAGGGDLIARIEHNGESEEMRVHVTTAAPPSGQGRSGVPHSFILATRVTTARSHCHA